MARRAPLSQMVPDTYDPRPIRELVRSIELRLQALERATASSFTITNPTTNRMLDVSGGTLDDVKQVVGTLIADLQQKERI